mgnify:FL=1|nr:MAG TPA: N-acetylmuramoyl-L-alanine amidase [Caudoviricetes sp.]
MIGGLNMNLITSRTSPNIGGGNTPQYVVIHHWGGDGLSFWGVVNWLCNPRARVSAHYVVGGNDVACLVNEGRAAWHAGNRWYNTHSIGIECRPEMDSTTYKTVIETVAMIYRHVGKVLPVIGHKDIVATACPGRYYAYLKDIQAQATALYQSGKAPSGVGTATSTTTGKLAIDGEFGRQSVTAMQKWLGSPYRDGVLSGQLLKCKPYILNMSYGVKWGIGGSATVKILQRVVGVGADGYLGHDTICGIQRYLNSKGYSLTVDGYAGYKTCSAFQNYLNKVV